MTPPSDPDAFLRSLLDAALAAVSPARALPPRLPPRPETGRVLVLGAGKASAHMAAALEAAWGGPLEGVVTVPPGYETPTRWIAVVNGSHPTPDASSVEAAEDALRRAETLGEGDTLIGLISGGGSALWCAPAEGVTLEEMQATTKRLLSQGAPISEINRTRAKMDRIKGGGLARAAFPARTLAFAISDVPGDDPALIASGPCAPPAGDPAADRASTTLIAAAGDAIAAAGEAARAAGIAPEILGEHIEGDVRHVAREHAELALTRAAKADAPVLLLSGGELTVTITGDGRGGPNTEYALAVALAVEEQTQADGPRVWTLAADTDGRDGASGVAGALTGPETLARARAAGLDPAKALENNDSAPLLEAVGALVDTGPTGTNVSDFRAILVLP